jgi:hypothetical protein
VATIPVEITWVTAQLVTAAQMNSNIRDGVNFVLSTPVFEGRQTAAQPIATGTNVGITFDAEDIDTDNGHSTSVNTTRYVAQTAGRFRVGGGVSWVANATGRRAAIWFVNSAATAGSEANMATAVNAQPCATPARSKTLFMNIGDYVELAGLQDSGGSLNTGSAVAGSLQCNMSVQWIGTT